MIALLIGCLAFLPFALSDLVKLRGNGRLGAIAFACGGMMLAGATLALLLNAGPFQQLLAFPVLKTAQLLGCFGALSFLVYTLFFALPLSASYATGKEHALVSSGIYALCRHPGVWCLALFYLFFWLLCGTSVSFLAFLLFTALDLLYVIWQDGYVFPRSIVDYKVYQATTPFLLPTRTSLRACFHKQ